MAEEVLETGSDKGEPPEGAGVGIRSNRFYQAA